ncbi:AMP-binding protein [Nonomuraea sp. NPDC050202]|uniref:AMP-binding protein n=1 Tax=Nonomuraea sp. NPDC050202 TaxID=3155035 RepID=UPI0033E7EBAC
MRPAQFHATECRRLLRLARSDGGRPLLSSAGPDGVWTTMSAAELTQCVVATVEAALETGAASKRLALVALPNGEAFIRAILASWWLGLTPVIVPPEATTAELDRLLSGAGIDASRTYPMCGDVLTAPPAAGLPERAPEPQPGWYLPSGGSTGLPALIPVPQPPGFVQHSTRLLMSATGWTPDGTQLVCGPLSHTAPFTTTLAGLVAGAHVVLLDRFTSSAIASAVARWPPTWCQLTPHQMALIDAEESLAKDFCARLHGMFHSAAPCPAQVKRRWIDRLGPERVYEVYGATQMVGTTVCGGREWLDRPGTVGRPAPHNEVVVLGEDSSPLPPYGVGEVFFRSSATTSAAPGSLDHLRAGPDGFFSVGDLGYLDDDGYLFLTSRLNDVIIVGGANVSAREVEAVLLEREDVREALVVGREDPVLDQVVHAIVVPADPARPPAEGALLAHCRERLSPYKVPLTIEYTAELARSHAGKIELFRYRGDGE